MRHRSVGADIDARAPKQRGKSADRQLARDIERARALGKRGADRAFLGIGPAGERRPQAAALVELFPTRIRARAVGFTFSWSRVSSIFVGYWVADLLAAFGTTGVFVMIGAAMAAIVIGIGIFGPRTNGRSLELLSP